MNAVTLQDKVQTIMDLSDNGSQLDPSHIRLIHFARANEVSQLDKMELDRVYELIVNKRYEKTYLHGIENMTADHKGYIYWKNQYVVEHYNHPYEPCNRERLVELANRCRHVEGLGIKPSVSKVIWFWDLIKDLTKDHPYFALVEHGFYEIVVRTSQEMIISFHYEDSEIEAFISFGNLYCKNVNDWEFNESFHRRRKQGWHTPDIGQGENFSLMDAGLGAFTALMSDYQVPHDIMERVLRFKRSGKELLH